jgi:hypothetical protein
MSNLVNATNQWDGNYISTATNDRELLASYRYSKTNDQLIEDPDTQFLLSLEAYVDKTAKTAGMPSYCGKPFIMLALHLKKSVFAL